jgi:CD2 antigen cytoplasmic tail-binding protein 2
MSTTRPQFDTRNPLNLVRQNDEDADKNEESILLEQDIEGSRPKSKRNKVKLDFESDSSDDGQTRREKELEKANAKGSDEDDDMFSDEEKEDEKNSTRMSNNNTIKLMNMDAFEKESEIDAIKETRDDDNIADDENEEDVNEENVDIDYFVNPNDEEAGMVSRRTKTHEPKMEAFNLRNDMEEGNFDEDGNFIRNAADSSAHQDQWLDGISKSEIRKARLAHDQRESEQQKAKQPFQSVSDLMIKLVELLEVGETPIEALQRLNASRKQTGRNKRLRRKQETGKSTGGEDAKIKTEIDEISHYSDLLLQRNISTIYDMTKEEILRYYEKQTGERYTLKRKRSLSPDQLAASPGWEFQWQGSDELHGPYDSATMKSWIENNYFDSRVSVRKVGTETFAPYDQVDYDL